MIQDKLRTMLLECKEVDRQIIENRENNVVTKQTE